MYFKRVVLLFLIYHFPLAKSGKSYELQGSGSELTKQASEVLINKIWDRVTSEETLLQSGTVLNDVIIKQSSLLKKKFEEQPDIPGMLDKERFLKFMENISPKDLETIAQQIKDND